MAPIPTDERRFKAPKAPKVTPTVSVVRPTGTAPQGKLGSPSAVGFKPAYTSTSQVTQNTKGFSSNPVTNPGFVKPAANLFEYAFQPTYDKYVAPYMPSSNTLSQNNSSYINYINPQYTAPAGKKYDWLTDAVDTAAAYMSGKNLLRGIAPVPSYAVDINSMPSANAGDYSQWLTDPRVTQNTQMQLTDKYRGMSGSAVYFDQQNKLLESLAKQRLTEGQKPQIPPVPGWAKPPKGTGGFTSEEIDSIIPDDPDTILQQKINELLLRLNPNWKVPVASPFYKNLKKFRLWEDVTNPENKVESTQAFEKLIAMTERMRLNQKRYGAFASPEDLQRNIVPFGYKPYYDPGTNIGKPVVPYSRPDKNNQVLFPGDRLLDSQKFANPKMLNSIIQQLRDIGLNKLAEDILNQNTQQLRIRYPGYLQSNDEHPNFNTQLRPIKPNQPYPNTINPFKFSSGD